MSIDYADYVDTPEFRMHFKQVVKLLEENGLIKDADEFDYYAVWPSSQAPTRQTNSEPAAALRES